MISSRLILVRHGESVGNARNIFTGWIDLPLTERGRREARQTADRLAQSGQAIDAVFSSALQRARETAEIIIARLGRETGLTSDRALNERDYGELAGLNKREAAERFGADQVRRWRRGFYERPPGGESLEDTVNRIRPYFKTAITAELAQARNVLVVAHGNSLRALIMIIEHLSPQAIEAVEIATGEIIVYEVEQGRLNRTKLIGQPGGDALSRLARMVGDG